MEAIVGKFLINGEVARRVDFRTWKRPRGAIR